MNIRTEYLSGFLLAVILLLTSCGKEFLEKKRTSNQVIPTTISDYQALLDNVYIINQGSSHELSIASGDEFWISREVWQALAAGGYKYLYNAYVWNKDVFEGGESNDWNLAYQRILYANMAMEAGKLDAANADEAAAKNNVVGSALFIRALNFYNLAQLFCAPYTAGAAVSSSGIPLRLDYDVSIKPGRSTLAQTYTQIIADLERAVDLLPEVTAGNFRPGKAAALALLARVYLQMGDFQKALECTDRALEINSQLIDFKTLENKVTGPYSSSFPFNGIGNKEILFNTTGSSLIASVSRFNMNGELLSQYGAGDLRRVHYFYLNPDGRTLFVGSYWGQGHSPYFTGLATDELWLNRAECYARLGDVGHAMSDLNHLLANRFDSSFVPLTAGNSHEALLKILQERRKELFMRGTRWEDLRRLNKEEAFSTGLKRTLGEDVYELKPDDPKWTLPIPDNEIAAGGIEQNPR